MFFFSSLRSFYISLLDLDSAVMDSSTLSSQATAKLSVFGVSLSAPVSSASKFSIICFISKKSLISNYFSYEWPTKWDVLSHLFIYASVFRYSLRSISVFLLALASAVMASSTCASSATAELSVFEVFKFLQSVQIPNTQSSISFQRNYWYLILLVFNVQPNDTFYHLYLYIYILKKLNRIFPFWFDFLDWPIQSCSNVIEISNHFNIY